MIRLFSTLAVITIAIMFSTVLWDIWHTSTAHIGIFFGGAIALIAELVCGLIWTMWSDDL